MRRKAKADPSDPQQVRVYAWEVAQGERFNRSTLTLAQCGHVIDTALRYYGCDPVELQRGSPYRYSWNEPEIRVIVMQGRTRRGNGGMNVPTVLHEVAHQIVWDLYCERFRDHGRQWLDIYRDLLLRARVLTPRQFNASARRFDLKWGT